MADLANLMPGALVPVGNPVSVGSPVTIAIEVIDPPVDRAIPKTLSAAQSQEVYAPLSVLFSEIDWLYHPSSALLALRTDVVAAFSRGCRREDLSAFVLNMKQWEMRAFSIITAGGEAGICRTYAYLKELLQGPAKEQSLPWQSRSLAASHFLIHAADPFSVAQGRRIAAGLTCLIQRVFSRYPSRAAQMLAGIGIDAAWSAYDKQRVVFSEASIKPKKEELLFEAGQDARSYACQLLQLALFNNCLQRRAEPLSYEESVGRPGSGYLGQTLVAGAGNQPLSKENVAISVMEIELLSRFEFGESGTVIANSCSVQPALSGMDDRLHRELLIQIGSQQELSDVLLQAKNEGRFPLSIAVAERRLLSDVYRDGIDHVINVTDFDEYGRVRIFNPHTLPGMRRHASVSLQRLYNASLSVG